MKTSFLWSNIISEVSREDKIFFVKELKWATKSHYRIQKSLVFKWYLKKDSLFNSKINLGKGTRYINFATTTLDTKFLNRYKNFFEDIIDNWSHNWRFRSLFWMTPNYNIYYIEIFIYEYGIRITKSLKAKARVKYTKIMEEIQVFSCLHYSCLRFQTFCERTHLQKQQNLINFLIWFFFPLTSFFNLWFSQPNNMYNA